MPRKRSNFLYQTGHDGDHLKYAATLDFARKLRRIMMQKHLSQSDLARLCWGEEKMANGFYGARGRDKINKFVQGKALPDPETLALLAQHLKVPKSKLAPLVIGTKLERGHPELRVTVIAGHRDHVHITLDTVMPLAVATQIIALIPSGRPVKDA